MSKLDLNTFEKGMNLDSSRVIQSKNTAFSTTNFRPWTDDSGKAVGGLVNIKGNELSFQIPDTSPIFQFVTTYPEPNSGSDTIQIVVNGVATNIALTFDTSWTNEEVTASIVDQINSNATAIAANVVAYLSAPDTFLVANLGTQHASFAVNDGSAYLAKSTYLASQADVQIIGWTTIRDSYYLFTTNDTTTSGGPGQIWKLDVDDIDYSTTLSIVYNGELNFSTKYPIEALGRYENDCTKRLYWTDNFNEVRTIQTLATNVFFTDPANISVFPILSHSLPVLQEVVTGGNLLSGIYQVAYRLRSSSGAETTFSLPSRMIPIVSTDENATNAYEYLGEVSGNNTGKAMTITVDNLDTDYNYIELVTLYRASKNSTAVITSVITESIPANGSFTYTIDGNESNSFTISLEEFLLPTKSFTHAKTLTSKDNRLFAANTRYEGLDFSTDVFDPRAYAFEESSDVFNIDGTAYDMSAPGASFADVPSTANAVNDDYSVNKFQQNSTIYGGTGEYISYKIKTRQVLADNKSIGTVTSSYESLPIRDTRLTTANSDLDLGEGRTYPQPILWDSLRTPYTFELFKGYQRDEIYRFAIVFYDKHGNTSYAYWIADVKIPESFDPNRNSYGTDNYTNGGFRGKLIEGGYPYYYNIPYVEFEVDLPADVLNVISGYSIVRVERESKDRTVVAQGLGLRTGPYVKLHATNGPDLSTPIGPLDRSKEYLFSIAHGFDVERYDSLVDAYNPNGDLNLDNTYDTNGFDYRAHYLTVQFPEHLYTNELKNVAGDFIKTVDTFGHDLPTSPEGLSDIDFLYTPSTDINSIIVNKKYKQTSTFGIYSINPYATNIETDIEGFWTVGDKQELEIDAGLTFRNEIYSPFRNTTTNESTYHGWGQKTILIKTADVLYTNSEPASAAAFLGSEITTTTGTNDGGLNGASYGGNFYIINYKRNLVSQYGGNSYNQKSQNTYISTGNFIQVDTDYTVQTFSVFGGDTFMTIMDVMKARKSWDHSSGNSHPRRSLTYLFPVESTIQTEYRHGRHMQSHLVAEDGTTTTTSRGNTILTGNCDLGETYDYNNVYSCEDNIVKFYAKPFDFQDGDCTNAYDTRIYASDPKTNGEVIDSWQFFRTNEFIDLESLYGPINKIHALNDAFFALQDRSTCIVSVNPRVQTTTTDGQALELGTGAVLHDYNYLSTSIGTKHQWSVIPTRAHLYWFDVNNSKMYRAGADGLTPLSDYKGIFAYLEKNVVDNMKLTYTNGGDNPIEGKGVTGYYDYRNNEVVLTFLGKTDEYVTLGPAEDGNSFTKGSYVYVSGNPYKVIGDFRYDKSLGLEYHIINYLRAIHSIPIGFSIVYNEFAQQYTSFYTFESPIYLFNPSTLFSVDSEVRQDIYLHNVGERANFYGFVNDSEIQLVSNDMPIYTKVFDNLIWHTVSTDTSEVDVPLDTFYQLQASTTYQDTDYTNLINNNTIKRKERSWQTHVPRSNTNLERMRDKHMELNLYYDNTDNNRFVVHYVGTIYRPSFR